MKQRLNKILLKTLSDRLGRSATRLELTPHISALGVELLELTDAERKSILSIWGMIAGGKINFDYWKFYKSLECDSLTTHVPDDIYWSRIIRALNPVSLARTYINKSLYPIIFKGLAQPEVVVNVINGIPYDTNMNRLANGVVAELLNDSEVDMIIKKTTASSGGRGVSKISASATLSEIKQMLVSYGQNYICQKMLRQSDSTAIFNKSSLNTFRVNTINLNGKVTCECIMFRHGTDGSIIDNFDSGGVACGLTKLGEFNGRAFNGKLKRLTHLPNGLSYNDVSIPGVSDVIDSAVCAHQRFMPHIGHAAWDFAIDENENPVMIEVNLMLPGIQSEQLSSGRSIFGDRTEEVIKYSLSRNEKMPWTEFVGGWQ